MSASEKPRVSKRIAAIAESATLAVDSKAKALKAAGRPVIGFGAGEPDFPTPDYIVNAAIDAAKLPANHRYTPTPGLPELRDAIVKKTKRDSNYEITADQVLVTNGGKQSVYQSFASVDEQEIIKSHIENNNFIYNYESRINNWNYWSRRILSF